MTEKEILEQLKKDNAIFLEKSIELEKEVNTMKNPLKRLRLCSQLIAAKVLAKYTEELIKEKGDKNNENACESINRV